MEKKFKTSSRVHRLNAGPSTEDYVERALAEAVGFRRLTVSVEAGCQDSLDSRPYDNKSKETPNHDREARNLHHASRHGRDGVRFLRRVRRGGRDVDPGLRRESFRHKWTPDSPANCQ